jgi:hypothetical protein
MEFAAETEGVIERSTESTRSIYSAAPPHPLLFSEEISTENDAEERKIVNLRESVGRIAVISGGEVQRRDGVRSTQCLGDSLETEAAVLRGPPGTHASCATFDLERQQDVRERYEFLGIEAVEVDGLERSLRHLRISKEGDEGSVEVFVDESGAVAAMRLGEFLELRLEAAGAAVAGASPVAAFAMSGVDLEGFDTDLDAVEVLELEWSGSPALLPARAGQTSVWIEEGKVQRIRIARARVPDAAARRAEPPAEARAELVPDSLCNSDHAAIVAQAKEIVDGEPDPWRRVERIVAWLQSNIEADFGANRSTALAVLDAKRGDCTEFTVLASGLLRASGIPTRRVDGVALLEDEPGRLHGHAWVEVWMGGWIAVDPTFGQAPADCGHVCFGGERDFGILPGRGMRARVLGTR